MRGQRHEAVARRGTGPCPAILSWVRADTEGAVNPLSLPWTCPQRSFWGWARMGLWWPDVVPETWGTSGTPRQGELGVLPTPGPRSSASPRHPGNRDPAPNANGTPSLTFPVTGTPQSPVIPTHLPLLPHRLRGPPWPALSNPVRAMAAPGGRWPEAGPTRAPTPPPAPAWVEGGSSRDQGWGSQFSSRGEEGTGDPGVCSGGPVGQSPTWASLPWAPPGPVGSPGVGSAPPGPRHAAGRARSALPPGGTLRVGPARGVRDVALEGGSAVSPLRSAAATVTVLGSLRELRPAWGAQGRVPEPIAGDGLESGYRTPESLSGIISGGNP